MAKEILITFVEERVSVRALLLEDQAPRTCETVLRRLPFAGKASHAAYSGTIVALHIDPSIDVDEENATTCIQTGDVMFTHYRPGFRHGHPEPVSEIYWAYDRYARPTIPGQWVPATANVFGRIVGDPSAFYEVCRRIRKEGVKPLEIKAAP
jgi:hypothetical protein